MIGVFDSGVGGLSVLRHLWRLAPGVPVLYVADSGRAPYGNRPPEQIRAFGVEIAAYLRRQGARLLVVACNTSSAVALADVQEAFGGPVVGMLEPAARAAAHRWQEPGGRVGVLATAATVASGAYRRALAVAAPHLDVIEEACPEWVPLVEAGRLDGDAVREAVRRHIRPLVEAGVRGVLLGCTHYPFLRPVIEQVLAEEGGAAASVVEAMVLDPGEAVAAEAVRRLSEAAVAVREGEGPGADRFVTSGDPEAFREALERLVGPAHRAAGRTWACVGPVRWKGSPMAIPTRLASELPVSWQGVRVAVIGLGVENLPLVRYLVAHGANVVAADRKNAEELGPRAEALEKLGVRLVLGERYLDALEGAEVAFVTPGLPKHLPAVEAARRAGVVITGQTDLFMRLCPAPIVGITGSSGKTTTTSLIGRMLRGTRRPVFVGGNIGEPLIERLGEIGADAWVVLELSSFQLETTGVSPHVAVVTNVTPNHLDVHPSMEAYVAAKTRILAFQGPDDVAVLNADNPITVEMAGRTAGRVHWFGRRPRRPGAWVEGDRLVAALKDAGTGGGGEVQELCRRGDIRLRGEHNVENVLAAATAALCCGTPVEAIREVVRTFEGVPHRLEEVARIDGVLYVNDSIATTPARAIAGLRSFEEPVVLIAGGYDKHLPFDEFAKVAVERCRHVVLLGQTAGAIERALERVREETGRGVSYERVASLEQAVAAARQAARPGDVVLLSPACASYDMFRNFEERGARFRQIVRALQEATS
ncbi:MAG TPA: UDP-N-acetylmuramoyl-L-alanine--D-glutamate ligase [Limnochordales bacterium]